jgi:serine/threonine protein phosphatase 1
VAAQTYVIGDVHGMLAPLKTLLAKLPQDATVVFVGDLIDRGAYSAEVVELIRQKGYQCVLGNHEATFIRFFQDYFEGMGYEALMQKWAMWLNANGGKETLQSYGFWENPTPSAAVLDRIRDDMEWMERLPLYLELGTIHPSGLPVVVSHSNITSVWHLRDVPDTYEHFKDIATRTRDLTCRDIGIINIYGHTPTPTLHYHPRCINVDTGCCYDKEGFGRLTAYGVEEGVFITQR